MFYWNKDLETRIWDFPFPFSIQLSSGNIKEDLLMEEFLTSKLTCDHLVRF